MSIRPAVPDDIPAILRIEQQSDTAAHWNQRAYDNLFAADASPRRTLVAASEEVTAAICGFLIVHSMADEWEIENLVVALEQRRHGVGSKLLQQLLHEAAEKGAKAIILEVRESNVPARRLYEKHGFSQEGRRPGYYQNPVEDALLLRRVLQLCNNIP